MKKKILSVLTLIIALFLITSCFNNKKTLSTPENVKVSSSGLVTWDAVENAEEYFVVYTNEDTSGNKTVTENEYQLEDTSSSWDVTVIAKASKYEDSSSSEKAVFVGSIQIAADELADDLISTYLGTKKPNLTPEEEKRYDDAVKYLKSASRKAVKLGYDEEKVEEIIELLGNSSSDFSSIVNTSLTVLNIYSKDEIISSLYFTEISLVALLLNVSESMISTNPEVENVISDAIEALQEADVELVNHLYNIIEKCKNLVSGVTPLVGQIADIVSKFEQGTLDAKTVVSFKSNVVKILKSNAINKEDVAYILNLIGSMKPSLDALVEELTKNDDLALNPAIILGVYKELSPYLDKISGDDIAEVLDKLYMSAIDMIDSISEEFISEVLAEETLQEKIIHLVVEMMKKNLVEPSEDLQLPSELILSVVNAILEKTEQLHGITSLNSLLGLTDEQLIEFLDGIGKLYLNNYETWYNLFNEEGIIDAIVKALSYNGSSTGDYGRYVDIYSSEDYNNLGEDYKRVLEMYNISEFDSFVTYKDVDKIVVSEHEATVYYLQVKTEELYDNTGTKKFLRCYLTKETVTYTNVDQLVPLIKILVKDLDLYKDNCKTFINSVLKVLPSVKFQEGLIPENVLSIIEMFTVFEDKSLDKLIDVVFKLVSNVLKKIDDYNLNEVVAILEYSDYYYCEPKMKSLLLSIGTTENIDLMKEAITEIGDVFEKIDYLSSLGYESKQEFIDETNKQIDDFFELKK